MRSCENNSIAYDKPAGTGPFPIWLPAGLFIIFRVGGGGGGGGGGGVYWKRTA